MGLGVGLIFVSLAESAMRGWILKVGEFDVGGEWRWGWSDFFSRCGLAVGLAGGFHLGVDVFEGVSPAAWHHDLDRMCVVEMGGLRARPDWIGWR
jgi:hypothetical protein